MYIVHALLIYHSFFLGIYQLDSLGINGKRKERIFENAVTINLISIMSELNVQISGFFFCISDYLPLLKSTCKYFVGFLIFLV